MSAYTAAVLDELRDHALTIGTATQTRFRAVQYAQARSVTPPLVVAWHDVTGLLLGRVTWAQRRQLATIAAASRVQLRVDVDTTDADGKAARLRARLDGLGNDRG